MLVFKNTKWPTFVFLIKHITQTVVTYLITIRWSKTEELISYCVYMLFFPKGTGYMRKDLRVVQSRSQSLVPFDQRSENESSGSNHFEITKEITEFWLSGSLRICIYGACLKWLLSELSIPAAGQKDRRLWGREWELSGYITRRTHNIHFLDGSLLYMP